jgi:hypothetical protein
MSTATATKERPILFSAEMVRAILDGRKTQTRRIVKPQPEAMHHDTEKWELAMPGCRPLFPASFAEAYCRHGRIGDKLWVRETWQYTGPELNDEPGNVYRATDPDWESMEGWKWKPSIHMPRCASRITLEITGVRVERLQDIGEEDAKSEGIYASSNGLRFMNYKHGVVDVCKPEFSFMTLWQSLYGDESWNANPFVWVIEFRRIKP